MTSLRRAEPRQLDAVGEMTIVSPDGTEYRLSGAPGGLDLRARRFADLLALKRQGPGRNGRSAMLAHAHSVVSLTGLSLRVLVADNEVVRLNPKSSGGWLARFAGIGPAEIVVPGLLRALWQSVRQP